MRAMLALMGIGIIAAGCGGETGSGSTTTGAGGTSETTMASGATTSGGGQGGSGGAASTTASSSTTGSATSSTSSSATSSTGSAMGAIFGATCTVDADCASGLCATFMQKGMHCSVKCATSADCPPQSPGCGGQGVCKPPA